MIRVVIVDDEPLILRSVKQSIESSNLGYRVVATANDGCTALELIERLKPDLVFTDVRMPVMDGLELTEHLRASGNQTSVVVLSGYQEFEYAKKSIQLGVLDYLVKPLNPLTLHSFLENLANVITGKKYQRQKAYLYSIIHSSGQREAEGAVFSAKSSFHVIRCVFNAYNFIRNNQFISNDSVEYRQLLETRCEKYFQKNTLWILNGRYENEYVIITEGNEVNRFRSGEQLYEDICHQLTETENITMILANKEVQLESISQKVRELDVILCAKSIYGKSMLCLETENRIAEQSSALNIELDKEFFKMACKNKRIDLLVAESKKIIDTCRKCDYTQAQLIITLRNLLRCICVNMSEYDIDFMLNLCLVESRSYDMLKERVGEIITECYELLPPSEEYGVEEVVIQVRKYLDQNYRQKIIIREVAEKFGINHPYLCNLFRKMNGISPNEYLIMKRLEEAKKLLNEHEELNVKTIAQMVGYDDPYYFSRLFKTVEHVSPKEFRKKRGEE